MVNKLNSTWFARLGIVAALAFLATLWLPSAHAAETQTLLRPDPLSVGLKSGGQTSISIVAQDVQNMYGIEFHLQYDPNIVEIVDADAGKPGVQIASGDWLKNTFVASNKADNAAGTIDYAVTLLNPAPAISGSGTIATITLKAKNIGTSPLAVQKAIFASRDGKEIKSSWQNGAIGVSPLGIAPSVDQTQHNGGDTGVSPEQPQALPIREIVLLGAAGLGVVVFLGALVLAVVAFVVFRRR